MRNSTRFAVNPSDLVILLTAFAMTAVYVLSAGGGFPLDDSWIHQTYARNLALTGQWAFVPGVPSAASTSPLYTVVLALGYTLGVPYTLWTHALGGLALGLAGMIGRRLGMIGGALFVPKLRSLGLITGLALVFAWHLIWAAASGMETMIFAMLTLALIWLGWREVYPTPQPSPRANKFATKRGEGEQAYPSAFASSWQGTSKSSPAFSPLPEGEGSGVRVVSGVLFGIVGGLATLARPEGALLVGMVGLALLIAQPRRTWMQMILWGVVAGMAYLLTLSPYLLFNLSVTGGLLPNTAAAKQAWAAPLLAMPLSWRLEQLLTPLAAGGQLLLVPGMLAFVVLALAPHPPTPSPSEQVRQQAGRGGAQADTQKRVPTALAAETALMEKEIGSPKRSPLPEGDGIGVRAIGVKLVYLLPILWGVALILLYALRLPLPFQHGRYVIPALPALIVAGVLGTAWLYRRALGSMIGRVLGRTLALAAALLFAVFAFTFGLSAYRQDVSIINQEMVTAAYWVADNLPTDQLLAIHDIGAVGYFAPRPMLDIAGLVTPEVIPIILDGPALWNLMQERGAVYLMAMDDQVPGDDPTDQRLCPIFDTEGTLAPLNGGSNIVIYRINWDGGC
jgi:hypothetical protein